ncbi:glycerophosphodiester phosphodiesterase [Kallotenue papyrolyticum]|uniref:glycerophosphodiester phosphodiesterase n=1 Tax=Kallotenue papyrolyticum TaxID=1325125 RepID=UPI0004786463|nr:glycerophosphodiester phosphodiesterase [Kallotenue papyrolyticum]
MLQAAFGNRPGPYLIGHRGASGYAPENTMASFERAVAMGVDAIELDVHPTRDGELVVIHDPTLERTTNGRGLVSAHTLAELQQLDAGSWFDPAFAGERIPSLSEVLAWARGRTKVVIEIKQGPIFYQGIEAQLLATLERTGMRDQVLVISFDHHSVRALKRLAPEIPTGVLYAGRCIDPVALARAAEADGLMPYWALLTREEVEAAHAAGLFISPWGGPEQDYHFILATGVDAVAADFPDRPQQALAQLRRQPSST